LLAAILDGIEPHELAAEKILQQHVRELAAPFAIDLRLGQHNPFGRHRLQKMQRGNL
jgi:hypothetical protein